MDPEIFLAMYALRIPPSVWFGIIITVIAFIALLNFIVDRKVKLSTRGNVDATRKQQLAIFHSKLSAEFKDKKSLAQAIQDQKITENENCLINFQPLTVIHPGFLGPIQDGVYDEQEGVTTAIRMGARCFVLPIDYHDKETMPKTFPEANKPCLLFRDASETIRSINGGSISKVAGAIANTAWNDIVSQRNDPFILILYFMRTPQENTKEYLQFLSQVARDLAPLSPYLLGQTPEGVYNRQGRQDQLLYVNTQQLEKKLLVFCNIDTSGFRTAQKDFGKAYLPKDDLDYWVHMRIYKQNEDTSLGKTSIQGKKEITRALVDNTSYYTSLPTDATNKKNAITTTKEKFMISLSPGGKNPEQTTASLVLNTYGAQALPLLIVDYEENTKTLLSNWKYAWKAKPKEIRYVRPSPIPIKTQSPTVDAQGGNITSPR